MMIQTSTQRSAQSKKALALGFLLAVLLTASSLMLVAKPAHAETTFTVTNTADPGDGICSPGGCTLREAITAANNIPGADRINFHIGPVSEVKTISLTSGLPAITEAVFIDGYSQPGPRRTPSLWVPTRSCS